MSSSCSANQSHRITYPESTHRPLRSTDSPIAHDGNDEDDCTICLEPLHTQCTTTLSCNHTFHTNCLDDWVLHVGVGYRVIREDPDDEADEQYYDTSAGQTLQTTGCGMCRQATLHFQYPPPSRFITYTVQEIIQFLRTDATVSFESRRNLIGNRHWLQDPTYQAFHQTLLQDPTYDIPHIQANRPKGSIIFRDARVVRPGALRIHRSDYRFQIVLLTAQEMYYYLSEMYRHGWDVHTGLLQPQLDIISMRNRPLHEVVMHAIERGISKITQLDFHALYPDECFLQQGVFPYIELIDFDGCLHVYGTLCQLHQDGEIYFQYGVPQENDDNKSSAIGGRASSDNDDDDDDDDNESDSDSDGDIVVGEYTEQDSDPSDYGNDDDDDDDDDNDDEGVNGDNGDGGSDNAHQGNDVYVTERFRLRNLELQPKIAAPALARLGWGDRVSLLHRDIFWTIHSLERVAADECHYHLEIYERFPRETPRGKMLMGYDPAWADKTPPSDAELYISEADAVILNSIPFWSRSL